MTHLANEKQPTPAKRNVHRRNFVKGMVGVAGLGLSAGLVACGDATATAPAQAATTGATVANTTSVATTSATTTTAATTSVPTTAAATTSAPTTSAATTSATTTTAASGGDTGAAPAGYTQVGTLPADTTPVSFTSGKIKGYIYAASATQVTVFSGKCTHMGCEVPYVAADKKFECPCHGSAFDPTGEVLKGPASKRLPLFDNKVVGQVVYAKLS